MINGNPKARLQIMLLYLGSALLVVASLCIYLSAAHLDPSLQPTAIALNADDLQLRVGDQVILEVRVTPARATMVGKNEWTTSDSSIVSVYRGGTVIANNPGTAEIVVTRGDLKDVCTVTVRSK